MLCLSLACAAPQLLAKKKDKDKDLASSASEQKRAVHALNRLTFGPRPGDLQQVMTVGVDRWIDLQLHPEKIPDSAMESRLAPFRTLRMSSREMVEEFPDGQMIKQVMDGKKPMPSDPAKRAVYQVQIARLKEKRKKRRKKRQRVPLFRSQLLLVASQIRQLHRRRRRPPKRSPPRLLPAQMPPVTRPRTATR